MSVSQQTPEDPTAPASNWSTPDAGGATLTLTPVNARARLAFSDVVDWTLDRSQHGDADPSELDLRAHARQFMWVQPEPTNDSDVGRLIRQDETTRLSSSSPSPSSSSAPAAPHHQDGDKSVWRGCYFLDLDYPPLHPGRGWTAGREGDRRANDLILSVRNSTQYAIRQQHFVFQIHPQSGRVYVQNIRDRGVLEVDGTSLSPREICLLNNHSASLRAGLLTYRVQYAHSAYEADYSSKIAQYIEIVLGQSPMNNFNLTPTPASTSTLTVGQWSLTGAGTIGAGGGGRVSAAMNRRGKLVALKRISATQASGTLQRQVNTLKTLTQLADAAKEDRILRLFEVITDDPAGNNPSADVWFVLHPAVTMTLYDERGTGLASTPQGVEKAKQMVTSMLEALEFLHSRNWIHGDIKPPNIGIRHWDSAGASIVLLDLDDAIHAPNDYVPLAPGTGGTVGWLSPEREMTGFSSSADVWAVGVTALWLLFGRHPWPLLANPWRAGQQNEQYRQRFHGKFQQAVDDVRNADLGSFGTAILSMVRHPFARSAAYRQPRPTCASVLADI